MRAEGRRGRGGGRGGGAGGRGGGRVVEVGGGGSGEAVGRGAEGAGVGRGDEEAVAVVDVVADIGVSAHCAYVYQAEINKRIDFFFSLFRKGFPFLKSKKLLFISSYV